MSEKPVSFEAQVAERRYRQRLQAEMGSDWTMGREIAHREADALARHQERMAAIPSRVRLSAGATDAE